MVTKRLKHLISGIVLVVLVVPWFLTGPPGELLVKLGDVILMIRWRVRRWAYRERYAKL